MDNLFSLETSPLLVDRIKFLTFTQFVNHLFNEKVEKDHIYIYNSKLENEANHKFILDNWELTHMFDCHTEYNRKTKRLTLQILNCITKHLNETYHFKQPVQFDHIRETIRPEYDRNKTVTLTHYDLKLN
jgi:hypothetical protein